MTTTENNQRTQELLAKEGLESIGQKLFNTIYDLNGEPQSARRWVWELLQNAKDVIDDNGRIEIHITDTTVEFSHNGSPFLHDQLLSILSQRSTKPPSYSDEDKQNFFDRLFSEHEISKEEANEFLDTTGKFGTGFMTTYLLSKKVSLESLYRSNGTVKPFILSLDRDAATPDEMKKKVKECFSIFTELEKEQFSEIASSNHQDGLNCVTKFIYHLDADGKIVAEHAIADLHNAIPFVLSFVSKIKSISIYECGKPTTYIRLDSKYVNAITIQRIEKQSEEGNSTIEIARLSARHNALTIATTVELISGDKYRIIYPSDNTPRQFISFPLVGSETFPFPVIIHSPLFNSDNLRSHVFLNLQTQQDFDKRVLLNRAIFEKAIELFKQLLKIVSSNDWENLHFLAKSDLPNELTDDWYKQRIQKEIRKEILETEIVVTESGKRIKPKDAKFPIFKQSKLNEFWELCKYLINNKIPQKQDVEIWKKIIEANPKDWLSADFDFNLEKLLNLIQKEETFSAFVKTYFKNEASAFEALNKILRFTEDEDKDLLDRKEKPLLILPNQTEESTFADKKDLSKDINIPKEIKDVLKKIGEKSYSSLVRSEITVFERESKMTVKLCSDKIRDRVDKCFANKLTEDEKLNLSDGLFELIGYSTAINITEIETLHKFAKQLFPEKTSEQVVEISGAEDFDWKPCMTWITKAILKKISNLKSMDNLALELFNKNYPEPKGEYTKEEEEICFKVDSLLNKLINFTFQFEKKLLEDFSIIPNQLNELCKFTNEIFNDDKIPKELKIIIKDFGADCRKSLLHEGVTIILNASHDLKWICGQLDDIAIREQHNEEMKQPLRNLDKWITKMIRNETDENEKITINEMTQLFKSFFRQRSGIVLNTYDLEERDQFDEIEKSGMIADFANIVRSGAEIKTVKQIAELSKEMNLETALSILKQHPELTNERIEQLLELEELSKGWDPGLDYDPDDEQIRKNFENGWKGEAFVFKEMKKRNFSVEWENKSEIETRSVITDFEGEKHFIDDKKSKYDLIIYTPSGKVFIQVKATTTDIGRADQIALPISTREWKFIHETNQNESYYLARVFNINGSPELYLMKLETSKELK
ncbi:MAG: DUF3883 domain-containing protein [Bacteroidetes bacterium]|nr:DUF3883 domain-containing protein [Bacteroidota bacterium]